MPYLAQIAVARLPRLPVFGADYPTPDGSGIRDSIHVMDVADGHRVALEHMEDDVGVRVLDFGTGVGTSVLDLVETVKAASGIPILYDLRGAQVTWRPLSPTQRGVEAMCRDAWRLQQNPAGYSD
jgi:UDP-glucose 4-epimerase